MKIQLTAHEMKMEDKHGKMFKLIKNPEQPNKNTGSPPVTLA